MKIELGTVVISAVIAIIIVSIISIPKTDKSFKNFNISFDDEEVPGIGGSITKPDTCVAYYSEIDKKIHIKNIHLTPIPKELQ